MIRHLWTRFAFRKVAHDIDLSLRQRDGRFWDWLRRYILTSWEAVSRKSETRTRLTGEIANEKSCTNSVVEGCRLGGDGADIGVDVSERSFCKTSLELVKDEI